MSKDIEHVYGNMPSQFPIVYLHNIYQENIIFSQFYVKYITKS